MGLFDFISRRRNSDGTTIESPVVFEDLEAGLNREREQLERLKRHIAGERAASAKLKREREEAEAAAAKTDEPAAA